MHVLARLDWLVQHRCTAAAATVDDAEYGGESCSTDATAEQFTTPGCHLTAARR